LTRSTESKEAFQYGLSFNSYEVEKEGRTSLNLTPEHPFSFSTGFSLGFDVSFKNSPYNFGYIFRIITENNDNIDLILSLSRDPALKDQIQLSAIYNSGQILCNYTFGDINTDFGEWINVGLTVDSKDGMIKIAINNKEFKKEDSYFRNFAKVKIIFGKNDIIPYETIDVPKMSIRNISIKNSHGNEKYRWSLAKHAYNGVYDEISSSFALCEAPKWIMDTHCYWKVDTTFNTKIYPQFTFNPETNQIAVADEKTFYLYNIKQKILDKMPNEGGSPLKTKSNNLYYNPQNQTYFSYNFADKVSYYDASSHMWDNEIYAGPDPEYWHHNRFFSAPDSTLYTFGGYGFHLYKNTIQKYDFKSDRWEFTDYKGDTITPRYLAGIGALDDKNFLIFGGYGSEKGDQKLSPHNYYDLYSYNIETSESKKIWELDATKHNFVVANSLVVDTLNKCFYALCYPHQKFNSALQLYRFSLEKPDYELLADSIPYSFNDVFSYADLYLTQNRDQLIALTSYTDVRQMQANVTVYSLAFPPLNKMDLIQHEAKSKNLWIYLILFVLIILALFVVWKYKSKKPLRKEIITAAPGKQIDTVKEEEEASEPIVGIKPLHEENLKQSILLFGGFQVMDKKSNKITGDFTPTLKQLFLLILLYTLKDGKGISSVKLREILWFDKTKESAKNNRGVSLSKLRSIFEKIGHVHIGCVNSYWTVEFGDDIYCDYYEALILIKRLSKSAEHKDINRLVSIVSAGELLPNVETEWVDSFKADFSNRLTDLLLNLIDHASEYNLTPSMMVNIADAVFVHDSLNEDALKIKCTLLVEMGKNGLAQKTYMSFIKEYQSLFGTEFKYSFEQIIS